MKQYQRRHLHVTPSTAYAVSIGCICAVLDNNHGEFPPFRDENGKPIWWITGGCPVHAPLDGMVAP